LRLDKRRNVAHARIAVLREHADAAPDLDAAHASLHEAESVEKEHRWVSQKLEETRQQKAAVAATLRALEDQPRAREREIEQLRKNITSQRLVVGGLEGEVQSAESHFRRMESKLKLAKQELESMQTRFASLAEPVSQQPPHAEAGAVSA
jgi:chromosome segregation ATPase